MQQRTIVVIPVFNEADSIEKSINTFKLHLIEVAILFVDDGSKDHTISIIKRSIEKDPYFHLVALPRNYGYGRACREGAQWAKQKGFEWAIFADSDLTNSPEEIKKMLNLVNEKFDMIKANRFWSWNGTKSVDLSRRVKSFFFMIFSLACFRFKILDPANGFRGVKLRKYLELPLKSNNFSIIMEECFLMLSQNWKIENMNSVLGARDKFQRKSTFDYRLTKIWEYAKWPLKFIFGIGN